MAFINVPKRFLLNLEAGPRFIEAGVQEVEDAIADHWYVQANSEPFAAPGAAEDAASADTSEVPAKKAER